MLLLPEVKLAASPEGVIILVILYGIFTLISKVLKAANQKAKRESAPPSQAGQPEAQPDPSEGGFSLESVLREIERVKQEAERRSAPPLHQDRPRPPNPPPKAKPQGIRPRQPASPERKGRMTVAQDERGPMGRHSKTRLPASEEFEDRSSLEDQGSIEVPATLENLDETRRRRVQVDQDEGAEAVVQRRIQQAESRNRAFSEPDHRAFHQKIKEADPAQAPKRIGLTPGQLKTAFVWKEILGPPRGEEI